MRRVIGEFIERYKREWILQRLGYKTPLETCAPFQAKEVQPA